MVYFREHILYMLYQSESMLIIREQKKIKMWVIGLT